MFTKKKLLKIMAAVCAVIAIAGCFTACSGGADDPIAISNLDVSDTEITVKIGEQVHLAYAYYLADDNAEGYADFEIINNDNKDDPTFIGLSVGTIAKGIEPVTDYGMEDFDFNEGTIALGIADLYFSPDNTDVKEAQDAGIFKGYDTAKLTSDTLGDSVVGFASVNAEADAICVLAFEGIKAGSSSIVFKAGNIEKTVTINVI
ncbi:MAG: hypothetical protein IJ289_01765 [Clostridia bacterium]|nr:hypothetical protein [Clostridia bacterium]